MAAGGKQDALKGFTEESNIDDVVLAKVELEVLCSDPRADVSEVETDVLKGQWLPVNVVTLPSNFTYVLLIGS